MSSIQERHLSFTRLFMVDVFAQIKSPWFQSIFVIERIIVSVSIVNQKDFEVGLQKYLNVNFYFLHSTRTLAY